MPSYIEEHDGDIEQLASILQYRNVTKGKIISWLKQFDEDHQPVALKLLRNLRFYNAAQIHDACKTLCEIIKSQCGSALNNVIFMGLGAAGKSGATMLHRFRHANGMHTQRYDPKFKYATEITALPPNFNGTLVFLDDFIGSGSQATASLFDIVSIAPPASRILLLVVAGYQSAINEISQQLNCNAIALDILQDDERLFSDQNTAFTDDEKTILNGYCIATGSTIPYGFRDVASLVVFCDSVPDNTPSILIHEGTNWKPLFARI